MQDLKESLSSINLLGNSVFANRSNQDEGNQLGGAAEEGSWQGWEVLGRRGGYGSGFTRHDAI